ncbi:MAG: hypothetical protein HY908_26355 [Myxococcales bacterium]|nr:hypothetical protein [Myxococcales bacterium]
MAARATRRLVVWVLGLGVGVGACSVAKPERERRGPLVFASGATKKAGGANGASAEDASTILILPEEGPPAKLPRIGLRLSGIWPNFVANRHPIAGTYVSLAGPPDRMLMFVVKGYTERDPTSEAAAELFRDMVAPLTTTAATPLREGAPTRVALAGARRAAVAFRVGEREASSDWCVALVPSQKQEREGLVVSAAVDADPGTEDADCERVLGADHIAPLVASLSLLE